MEESEGSDHRRVLDIGCGTGYLLRLLAQRYPAADALVGVDPSPTMVERARTTYTDRRIEVHDGHVEKLPFQKGEFDLIVSTTSFDHWRDQADGLRECARVFDRNGVLARILFREMRFVSSPPGARRLF